MLQLPAVGSTAARGVFGAGFGFRVGWCAAAGRGGGRGGSASIGEAFIFAGGLGAGLSFHGVCTIS